MHLFITGGSGRNGKLTIRAALSKGHTVTALIRNPSSFDLSHPGLTLVKGTPTSQAAVEEALINPTLPHAITTTLGLRRTSDSPFAPLSPDTSPNFLSESLQTLLNAIHAVYGTTTSPLPKVVVNSSVGVRDSWAAMSFPYKVLFSISSMRFGLRDHGAAEDLLRASGLPFVLARPVRLTDNENLPVCEFPSSGKGLSWNPSVSRASVAEWLVSAAESKTWDRTNPILAN